MKQIKFLSETELNLSFGNYDKTNNIFNYKEEYDDIFIFSQNQIVTISNLKDTDNNDFISCSIHMKGHDLTGLTLIPKSNFILV